jgi:predicted PurR-regulated permease PerM
MGRGVNVPMLVIFIGAIGGFMTSGIIGLFIGAIILALGYKLFLTWLNQDTQPDPEPSEFSSGHPENSDNGRKVSLT